MKEKCSQGREETASAFRAGKDSDALPLSQKEKKGGDGIYPPGEHLAVWRGAETRGVLAPTQNKNGGEGKK